MLIEKMVVKAIHKIYKAAKDLDYNYKIILFIIII